MEDKAVLRTYEEKREQVAEFNLTSDLFAGKVFENEKACQELCRILMQDNAIHLKDVKTQYSIRNLESHSVELDILAEDRIGNLVGIEIQMYQEAEPFRRTRYYLSSIDMGILQKGKDYGKLPTVTMIMITKADFIGGKRGCYEICRNIKGKQIAADVDNGLYEKFYKTKSFPNIVKQVNYLKTKRDGVNTMCEIADRIRREGKKEGKIEGKIEGKAESVLELLAGMGKVPRQIKQQIRQETNLEVLSRWLKCAAKASSIAEFEANINV